jgi:hypothetical protein
MEVTFIWQQNTYQTVNGSEKIEQGREDRESRLLVYTGGPGKFLVKAV